MRHIAGLQAKDIKAARHAPGQVAHHARVAAHEPAHIVAKAAVPLGPTVSGKGPQLVEPRRVPRFGDQLGPGQDRFRLDLPENGRLSGAKGLAVLAAR